MLVKVKLLLYLQFELVVFCLDSLLVGQFSLPFYSLFLLGISHIYRQLAQPLEVSSRISGQQLIRRNHETRIVCDTLQNHRPELA